MFDPLAVKSASDLPKDSPVVVEWQGRLRLAARRPLLYSFHWLREVALGTIEGVLGLTVDAGGDASIAFTVTGAYRQRFSLDERGWLRLEVLKDSTQDLDFAAQLSVSAQAASPLPDKPDELVAAILGVHRTQWLMDLKKMLESPSSALQKFLPQISPDALLRFLDVWSALDPTVEHSVWQTPGVLANDSLIETLGGLKDYVDRFLAPAELATSLANLANYQTLDDWAKKQIEALFGSIQSQADIAKLLAGMKTLLGLKGSIYEQALSAMEKKYSAEVSYHYKSTTEETALLDCSFNFSEEGLRAYRQALGGDYSWMLEADSKNVEIRRGTLSCDIRQEATLELHLPFLDRKEWITRLEALAKMEVSSDADGRLLVYHVEASHRVESKNSYQSVLALAGGLSVGRVHSSSSFTLSYSDQRRLPPTQVSRALAPALEGYGFDPAAIQYLTGLAAAGPGDLDVSLALSIPGALVSAWLDAPGEREAAFFPVYSRVAVAVQRAMRTWLPYTYFSDISQYETLEAAFPLVVYQVSRPCAGAPKFDFTYDVMSQQSMTTFFRIAGWQLPQELARVEQVLLAAGKKSTAQFYSPKEARNILASVQRRPKLVSSLLSADAFFMDALVKLGCEGRQLRQKAAQDPAEAVKGLARFAADFVKAFHGRLRRLYGNKEFLALGALMLVEATNALNGNDTGNSRVEAVLRLSRGPKEQPGSLDQTLVNAAYLPRAS